MFSNVDESRTAETVAFSSSGESVAKVDERDILAFWSPEKAWQKGELEKVFVVTIKEPLTVAGTFTSYTTYLVQSTLHPEGVRRRYSDFDWLRDVLVARYHGIAVPLMPEKRMVGNQGKAFIEERMAGLENFMMLVLANPYLRNDLTMRMFLTQKGSTEFEQAKKAANQGVGANPAENPGLAHWFGVLRHLPLPPDADAACRELVSYCAETEAKLVGCLAAVTKYCEAAKAMCDAYRSVRDSFHDFAASCTAVHGVLSETLAPVKMSVTELRTRVKHTSDVFSSAHDLSVFNPNEIQIFLLDGLVSEIHRIRGLKSLLDVRDAAQREYSAAWQAHDKLTFQEKQFRDKGRADKADAMAPKVAEAKMMMVRMKERLDDISKGVLNVEADRQARTRVQRIVAMTGQYAALCIASGVRAQELWTSFLGNMALDQPAMVADAQKTLVGAMSMHNMDAIGPAITYVAPSTVLDAATPAIVPNSSTHEGGASGGAGASSTTGGTTGSDGSMSFTTGSVPLGAGSSSIITASSTAGGGAGATDL